MNEVVTLDHDTMNFNIIAKKRSGSPQAETRYDKEGGWVTHMSDTCQ